MYYFWIKHYDTVKFREMQKGTEGPVDAELQNCLVCNSSRNAVNILG